MADTAKTLVAIQLACVGAWRGHPAGPFELTPKVFDDIVRNFKVDGLPVPIDAEHASEAPASEGSIPSLGAPAMGWIHSIESRGANGLWGMVEWLEPAKTYIKEGRYRYLSPAVRFGARSRVTGEPVGARLTSAAITNQPFLKSLAPLVARDDDGRALVIMSDKEARVHFGEGRITTMRLAFSPAEYMPRIRCILGLSELSSASECADQLERLRQHFDAVGQDPDAAHEGIPLSRFVYALRSLVCMNMGHTWDDVFDCVAEMIAAAAGDVEDDEETEELTETMTADDDDEPGASMRATTATTTLNDAGATAGETDMTPEQIAALNTQLAESKVSLKDTTTKLADAEAKAVATELKVAELSLSLKDEASKREAAETELKTLKDKEAARETKDLADRVTLAFDQYKDAQKLTEDDKETMLIVLKAKPESFEKKYPKIAPALQHLTRNLSDKRETTIPTTADDAGGVVIDMAQAARTLAAQRGIPLADAQRLVYRTAHAHKPAR